MERRYERGSVISPCPTCGPSRFVPLGDAAVVVVAEGPTGYKIAETTLQCVNCSRLGVVTVEYGRSSDWTTGTLLDFVPAAPEYVGLPTNVPADLVAEFREAERCLGFAANRAAAGLFRSTLEKTLKANGYVKEPNLFDRIDAAAADGVISPSRRQRAHDDIRSLGNDVLHEPYRLIAEEEASVARHFTQRVLEDFYDDRGTVESVLRAKERL